VPGPGADRYTSPELATAESLVATGTLVEAVEAAIGALR
jgi:histidine ammonia-lyase